MTNIHFKTAWDHIRRSPFQAVAAFFVLSTTFFIITLLSILVYSSSQVINYFETRPQIIAFIKDEVQAGDISTLQDILQSDVRTESVNYVSKEEALEIYKKATEDNPLLSELVSPSIFPASLEVSLNDLADAQSLIEEIKGETIVDQVGFTASLGGEEALFDVVDRLKNITFYLRLGGGVFALVLTSTSLLVLIVIVTMRVRTRQKEVEILDLIGATPAFIRSPIVLEALIYTFGGVVLGWIFAFILILYATPSLISYFGDIAVLPKDTTSLSLLFAAVLGLELLIGFILAFTGSMLAVSRVRRK